MNIEHIHVDDIAISGTNPRKRVDQEKLDDLAESIRKNGLIQPITVRLNPNDTETPHKYEVVAGERRLRACVQIHMEEIPAIVRQLTDEEAFDIQVVENLQREDVHPLDEAEGFHRMLATGRYTVKEIAARMGKSESFVARRLQLNELCPDIKKAFYDDKLGIGHALEICRLHIHDQQDIFDKVYKEEDPWNGYPTVSRLTAIIDRDYIHKLSAAPFKASDATLVPEAGPCTSCPKRSGANPTLFGDVEDDDICFDGACFHNKAEAAFLINVEKAKLDENIILICRSPDDYVKELRKEGHVVLEEYDHFYEREGAKLKDPDVSKAFRVQGYGRGEFTRILLKSSAKLSKMVGDEPDPVELQIQRIEEREARAVELDREKVQKALLEFLGSAPETLPEEEGSWPISILKQGPALNFAMTALYLDGFDSDLEKELAAKAADYLKKKIPEDGLGWAERRSMITQYLLRNGSMHKVEILRSWYLYRCSSSSELDPEKYEKPFAIRELVNHLYKGSVDHFEKIQTQKADKRKARVKERISQLRETKEQEAA